MCQECPFRANALKGWLGPYSIDDFEVMIRHDIDLVCHIDIDKQPIGYTPAQITKHGQACVGMLRYMNSMFKQSRNPEKLKAQLKLKTVPDQPVIPANQFGVYHNLEKN